MAYFFAVIIKKDILFLVALRRNAGQGLLIQEVSRPHTTKVGSTPLEEWSARRRDLYLTTHNIQKKQTIMPPAGFEPTISEGERPQTYALDRAATGMGNKDRYPLFITGFIPLQ